MTLAIKIRVTIRSVNYVKRVMGRDFIERVICAIAR